MSEIRIYVVYPLLVILAGSLVVFFCKKIPAWFRSYRAKHKPTESEIIKRERPTRKNNNIRL